MRRRKLVVLFLAALMVLSGCRNEVGGVVNNSQEMVMSTISTEHTHTWKEATCETPKMCTSCGATDGESARHFWYSATCTEPRTCAGCGLTCGEAYGHNWTEATCESPKRCKNCGKTEGDPLPMLSKSCDMVVCKGNDNGDVYELVVNRYDAYPSSTYEFGVIKNNEWLVEMSSNCPFMDESGWWKGVDKRYYSNTVSKDDFQYIGGALFLYKKSSIYNPETGAFFENLCNRRYEEINNFDEFLGFEGYSYDGGYNILFKYYNSQTGLSREVGGYFDDVQRPDIIKDISCGLFYASGDTWDWYNSRYEGFFDLNGVMVLDLSEYAITDYYEYEYKNSMYTMTCSNDSGVQFNITFDITGNIISKEKVVD